MEVNVKYVNFSDVIKSVEIPLTGGSSHLFELTTKTVHDDLNQTQSQVEILKFTTKDSLDFSVSQEMTKDELRSYMEVLKRVLTQMK